MAYRERLIDLFEAQGVPYRTHRLCATDSQDSPEEFPGRCIARVVIALPDERPAMLVLGADREVDLTAVGRMLHGREFRPASESELGRLFPDCEPGATPPFGNWYGVPVYLDAELATLREVTFLAGSCDESVTVPTPMLERLSRAHRWNLAA